MYDCQVYFLNMNIGFKMENIFAGL